MHKTIATFINEFRLFRKDLAGVALLFLMPLALTIIMALIQDAPFREYQNVRFDILWVNKDSGKLAAKLQQGLEEIPQFRLITTYDNRQLNDSMARSLVQSGKYKIAIIIPEGITAEVVNSANQVANAMGQRLGVGAKLPQRATRPASLEIYFDPVTKQALKLSLLNALDKQLTRVQADMIMGRLSDKLLLAGQDSLPPAQDLDLREKMQAVTIRELAADRETKVNLNTNSVQHNVPAWAIFGLFFIIIPIAGNIIREREDGSLMRVRLVPGSYFPILLGRLFFYVFLGIAQFYLMLLAGALILPQLGLPQLHVGHHPLAVTIAAAVIALTATAYGLCIGAIFQTPNQALPFGAISIVILSAIGGIWVPVEILPQGLQQLARISPLHWSLDTINTLFLRNGTLAAVGANLGILLCFSAFFVIIAGSVEGRRQQ
jgi:ABC-2 type transport system permease protein